MTPVSAWAKKIEEQDLPILKFTSNSILHKVDEEDTTANQLAKIILRDSSLTAGLLKIANSVIFNPCKMPVNTIHRAVLFLGFDLIRSMCLSLSLIDTLLKTKSQAHVKSLMAKSFHAAVMARDLAERRRDKAPEEVFIAALLSSIGEIAFCCVAEDQTEDILRVQAEKQFSLESAQREVLGFTFDELSVILTSDLNIGDLVKKCARATSKDNDPRVKEINLSKQISVDCTANPHDEETRKLVTELSSYLKLDKRQTWDIILKQSEVVHETVGEYGAQVIIEYLPVLSQDEQAEENKAVVRKDLPDYPEENSAIQLGILKDLGEALETSVKLNGILQIVLEGINRGVGMDRVLFALLSPDRKFLKGKFALGIDTENLHDRFNFLVEPGNIFKGIFDTGKGVWVNKASDDGLYAIVNNGASKVFETSSFLLYPIMINKKPIGVLYADRMPSKREITQDIFLNFRHFGQQCCMAIGHISEKRQADSG